MHNATRSHRQLTFHGTWEYRAEYYFKRPRNSRINISNFAPGVRTFAGSLTRLASLIPDERMDCSLSRSPYDLHFKNNAAVHHASFCHRYDTRCRSALAPHKISCEVKHDNTHATRIRTNKILKSILKTQLMKGKNPESDLKK